MLTRDLFGVLIRFKELLNVFDEEEEEEDMRFALFKVKFSLSTFLLASSFQSFYPFIFER